MATRQSHLRLLRPYLVGEEPRDNGEWDMFCPLHEDTRRSASLNFESSEWHCFGCGEMGSVVELISRSSEWVPAPNVANQNGSAKHKSADRGKTRELPNEGEIKGWVSSLLSSQMLDWLIERRGLHTDTIVQFQIGWDRDDKVFTIPIRDKSGTLLNVRCYDPNPTDDRRKVWGYTGHNQTRLFPAWALNGHEEVLLLEGEWDTILAHQEGFNAVTRTGAATVWDGGWSPLFEGKTVHVCGDRDTDGEKGANKAAISLRKYARSVSTVELPYPLEPKHGKDFSDYVLEYGSDAFRALLKVPELVQAAVALPDAELVTVLDSFDARTVGDPARLVVTIKGKREPGYTIPRTINLVCDQSAGDKCRHCALNARDGEDTVEVLPSHPIVLEMIDATSNQLHGIIGRDYGIYGGKCNRLQIDMAGHQAVEILFARPSLDHSDGTRAGDYKNIKITSVGRHDTLPNNTVQALGALHPNPRSQTNEWLAWEVTKVETSVDTFELTPESVELMKTFQAEGRPLAKLAEISKELSEGVTRIYGRPEMHAFMDLVFHSVLAFRFDGDLVSRGWLDALVLGDTRTGKSEAASRLVRHYGVGEVIGGESASVAGLLGGLQTFGSNKEWTVTWGAIPINDKRIVVIDEASGLMREDIAKLSDARSRGEVKIQKIQQDMTLARTRILWCSNPRDAKMSDFTYGVQALYPLIGNMEDIARFDMVMCVAIGDVSDSLINRSHEAAALRFTSESCNTLIRWIWTRTPDQIVWAPGAEEAVFKAALDLGRRYTEDPPLLQTANARIKVARIAAAMAARLFSTDSTFEKIVITAAHVADTVSFLDKIYSMPSMGYAERSRELIKDRVRAESNFNDMKYWIIQRPGLASFLKGSHRFRRQDIEEVLNIDRQEANGVVNTLLNTAMVRKDGMNVVVEPTLNKLLREIKI